MPLELCVFDMTRVTICQTHTKLIIETGSNVCKWFNTSDIAQEATKQ